MSTRPHPSNAGLSQTSASTSQPGGGVHVYTLPETVATGNGGSSTSDVQSSHNQGSRLGGGIAAGSLHQLPVQASRGNGYAYGNVDSLHCSVPGSYASHRSQPNTAEHGRHRQNSHENVDRRSHLSHPVIPATRGNSHSSHGHSRGYYADTSPSSHTPSTATPVYEHRNSPNRSETSARLSLPPAQSSTSSLGPSSTVTSQLSSRVPVERTHARVTQPIRDNAAACSFNSPPVRPSTRPGNSAPTTSGSYDRKIVSSHSSVREVNAMMRDMRVEGRSPMSSQHSGASMPASQFQGRQQPPTGAYAVPRTLQNQPATTQGTSSSNQVTGNQVNSVPAASHKRRSAHVKTDVNRYRDEPEHETILHRSHGQSRRT